jgi:hypothetical protein
MLEEDEVALARAELQVIEARGRVSVGEDCSAQKLR